MSIIGENMPEEEPTEGAEEKQEDQMLDEFLVASGRVVRQIRGSLAKTVKDQGIAQAASMVFNRVDGEFEGLPDMVRFFGGIGVLSQIAAAAEKDGVKKLSEEERMKALATVLSEQIKKGIESGKYDAQEMLTAAESARDQMQAKKPEEEA